jgi:hypothetical protein
MIKRHRRRSGPEELSNTAIKFINLIFPKEITKIIIIGGIMKMKKIFLATFVFMFSLVSFWVMAEAAVNDPVAVSPGSETEAVTVWQSCPTFSWSAVDQAASYRIAVFESVDANITSYEGMAAMATPVISKDIPGPALSWTLSSEERLKTGGQYAWYVQALDAYGNALGSWSGGRIFKVEQEVRFVGLAEKLGDILKSYGVKEDTITNVLEDMKSEVQEVVVRGAGGPAVIDTPGRSGVQGYEGATNTFYGQDAGASITSGYSNTFVGANAGYEDDTGYANTFLGDHAGYSDTNGYFNNFLGARAGYANTSGYRNIFLGNYAGFSNTTGHDNTFIGNSAGYQNITGNYNTFLGYNAGSYSTTASSNIFLGYYTGYLNNTGTYNIFLGNYAGYLNDSGSNNTFLGYNAGYSNTTGRYNAFLGNYAGYTNTTGYYSTFLGYRAGNFNNGDYNTFLGNQAGYHNTTGYDNTFLGSQAGYHNTTAVANTFLGNQAGFFNETGSENAFLGNGAGFSNTCGYYNAFLGSGAGQNNTTGEGNVFLGYQTGDSNETGSFNIFLGYRAGFNETGSNKLYIADSGTSFPLIYGEFDTGRVAINGMLGIGIQTPTYPLHMLSGAYCTADGVWTDASSRSLKENIQSLSTGEALEALNQLNPVKYNYKADQADKHVGFIAEDVPDLVATADRKGMSAMDVTAVLTKVVQELQRENQEYKKIISHLQERMAKLEKK